MTVIEFIKRKNAIILQATGVLLVPEDQIQEVEQFILDTDSDASACPYCQAFNFCAGCPMDNAGNNCEEEDSSYTYVQNALERVEGTRRHMVDSELLGAALKELVNQYNTEQNND